MTTLLITAVLQVSVAATPANTAPTEADYATAFKRSMASGKPLVVLLGADWCPGCVQMKDRVLPKVAKAGGLAQVEYAYVDSDRQPKLAGRLSQARAIPQLIRYEKDEDGWQRDLLVGAQSVKKVTSFVAGKPAKRPESGGLTAALTGWAEAIASRD
jgi:thioredoxin-like negative regulator of GroEL